MAYGFPISKDVRISSAITATGVRRKWLPNHNHHHRTLLGEGEKRSCLLSVTNGRQLPWNVMISPENLDAQGLMLRRSIIIRLLDDFASSTKATKDLGYYVAVTTLDSIGEGRVMQSTEDVLLSIVFSGITFKIFRGEVLEGMVHNVGQHGVVLRCGPIERIFLSHTKMPDYHYVSGENPVFLNENLSSKIEKDTVVRFIVVDTKWTEDQREFEALANLERDYLGPASRH